MARPGFVHEVDERTPQVVVPYGDAFRLERLPLGARIIYPADSLPALTDVREAIEQALDAPLGSDPLAARLHGGMTLTLVVDDLTQPVPKLRTPDVRGVVAEAVLSRAAAAGVDDVAVIFGTGLNRRLTAAEQQRTVGERVYRSFHADGLLTNHDAEDAEHLARVREIEINSRVAASDLVVHIHLAGDAREVPGQALAAGIGSAATIGELTGFGARSAGASSSVPDAVLNAAPVFEVDVVLDNETFPPGLEFLTKREWEWRIGERARWAGIRQVMGRAPARLRRHWLTGAEGAYAPTQITAGDPSAVTAASREQLTLQHRVEVSGQADVGIMGVGPLTPYSIDSTTNPVLAAWAALAGLFGAHTGRPFVREGGALIVFHPMAPDFSGLNHPSYVDFFADVLPGVTGAAEIASEVEPRYAADPWYQHLYRTGHAFHGVHPLHRWYELSAAAEMLGDVVFVGADRSSVERLGFRAASSFADALEIVSNRVGRSPQISYLHAPPHLTVDVQ